MKRTKMLAVMISVMLIIGLFAGCAATTEQSETASQEEAQGEAAFKVGFLDQSGEAPPVVRMREIIRSVVETAGGELLTDTTNEDSADAQVNAVEKLISAGADGIIMTQLADSILPAIINMCEENGVYLGITFRNIGDVDVANVVEASEYYAGNCYEDEETIAYNVMSKAFEKNPDIKQIGLIALAIGDATSDARVAGITRAAEENGAEIVAEVRDINQASDATEAVQNFVAAFPDIDCVAVAGCYDNSAITALPEAIKSTGLTSDEISIVSCDGGADLTKLFDYGYAISVGGGHLEIDRGSTAVMLVNAIQGNPLGTPAHISIPYMYFGSVEDVSDYAIYVEGDIPIWTPEEISENLLISQNPDLTPEDVIAYIQAYSLESLVERHEDLV